MEIDRLTLQHIAEVDKVNRASLSENYDWYNWFVLLAPQNVSLGIRIHGKLVGYVCIIDPQVVQVIQTTARWHVASLAVLKEYRGRGYGKLLMQHGIQEALAKRNGLIDLYVRVDNEPALKLYSSLGFRIGRTLRRYYADGTDAHVMELNN